MQQSIRLIVVAILFAIMGGLVGYRHGTDSKQPYINSLADKNKSLLSTIQLTNTSVQDMPVTPAVTPATPAPSVQVTCHPISAAGNCFKAGQYCSDASSMGVASNGESIICEENNGLRWEYN